MIGRLSWAAKPGVRAAERAGLLRRPDGNAFVLHNRLNAAPNAGGTFIRRYAEGRFGRRRAYDFGDRPRVVEERHVPGVEGHMARPRQQRASPRRLTAVEQ